MKICTKTFFKNLIIIIAAFLLINFILAAFFINNVTRKQEIAAHTFKDTLSEFYGHTFRVLDIITSSLSKESKINLDNLNKLDPEVIESINKVKSAFNLERIIIVNKKAEILFTDHLNSPNPEALELIKNRDYFLNVFNYPEKVFDGKIVRSVFTLEDIVPFCKVIVADGKIKGAMIMGFPIKPYLEKIQHVELFKITPNVNGSTDNKLLQLLKKIFFAPKNLRVDFMSNSYDISVKYNNHFFISFIKNALPWNLVFITLIFIALYLHSIKHKIISMLTSQTKNYSESSSLSPYKISDLSINEAFKILSSTLFTTISKLKENDANLTSIENAISLSIHEVKKIDLKINALNEEINDLINDEELNLNDEYLSALTEYQNSTNDGLLFLENTLMLLKLNFSEMKRKKVSIKLVEIINYLSLKCSKDDCLLYNFKLKVFKHSFTMTLDLIKDYLKLICYSHTIIIDDLFESNGKILITLKGSSRINNKNQSLGLRDSTTKLQNIKFLCRMNGFNAIVKDSATEVYLTIIQL